MKSKLIAGLIIGGAAVVVALLAKKKEKKYAEVQSPEEEEKSEESDEIKAKIAKAATKVVNWILNHKDDIEAATLVISLASACVGFRNKVNEGRKAVSKTPPFRMAKTKMTVDEVVKDMVQHKIDIGHCETDDNIKFDIVMKGAAA